MLVYRALAKRGFWEFDSIIMTKFERRFAIVLYTNMAHYVNEKQEYLWADLLIHHKQIY